MLQLPMYQLYIYLHSTSLDVGSYVTHQLQLRIQNGCSDDIHSVDCNFQLWALVMMLAYVKTIIIFTTYREPSTKHLMALRSKFYATIMCITFCDTFNVLLNSGRHFRYVHSCFSAHTVTSILTTTQHKPLRLFYSYKMLLSYGTQISVVM